jgi:hypothetical protein
MTETNSRIAFLESQRFSETPINIGVSTDAGNHSFTGHLYPEFMPAISLCVGNFT